MAIPYIKKAYADTSHGQIHYRYALPTSQSPQKAIPLVFLHKSASSSSSYEKLMLKYAAKGYHCYAPDMPGFGSSFDPCSTAIAEIHQLGTRWYVDLFVAVFTSLGLFAEGKKVHLAGHHSGAVLAIEMAALYPEFVASVFLVGATIMDDKERAAMKEKYFATFNEPVSDGSHLLKTWEYLGNMGIGGDLDLWQREAVDHIRAWKGRNQIYGAVWRQDAERVYAMVKCQMLIVCSRDDVLWPWFGRCKELRPDIRTAEVKGGNFQLDRDTEGIEKLWTPFLEEAENENIN